MPNRNFFAELKRRNVYKVAVAYAVVSWLLIQAASIFLPAFNAPQWAMQIVIFMLVVGLPIALVFSWAFEITPEGIKRESELATEELITRHTGRKIVALTIALATIATGLLVFQFIRGKSRWTNASADRNAADAAMTNKSVAVLPFDNLSRDPDNAYFAEGVQDEILTRLAKVADLKVIARTSTQKFKSAPEDLPDIAKQLGIANILEGSVQRVNDQVRVNVQLVNPASSAHVWAKTYDRKLTDIFAVESEVAQTIADTLHAKLTGSEKSAMAKKPTENPEAYEFYLMFRRTELAWIYFALERKTDALRLAKEAADSLTIEMDALLGPAGQLGLAEMEAWAGPSRECDKEASALAFHPIGYLHSPPNNRSVWDPIGNHPDFQQLLTMKERIGP